MNHHNLSLQVFKEPDKLPTAQEAAFKSLPEHKMAGRRYELAEKLLRSYSPCKLLAFMFRFDRASAASQLLYPPEKAPENVKSNGVGLDPVTTRSLSVIGS